ncbi:ribosome modulation factor [Spartinivicinus ruber]|uniref:ribosome modulation factor n=1 Tax=Spartinivicinus ruber TaxID=2683272 RepID=UPI0013D02E9F|nr:ribosome modulation factor [Spartinivicinus ruber]
MRRHKRSKVERAFQKGYQIGISGRSRDLCPHGQDEIKQSWLNGWREGWSDQWDGYTGVSGVHKIYSKRY